MLGSLRASFLLMVALGYVYGFAPRLRSALLRSALPRCPLHSPGSPIVRDGRTSHTPVVPPSFIRLSDVFLPLANPPHEHEYLPCLTHESLILHHSGNGTREWLSFTLLKLSFSHILAPRLRRGWLDQHASSVGLA
ncbi:hypothetical protein B0H13DRAFT_2348359 [Mycena leptocephala]|nr:hypothetical protein B0H13DRAFT_2348359 [Mycena leptocephala]